MAELLVSERSPLTGPATTLSVTSLLRASVGMANPVMVTSCVLLDSMLAMDAVCLMVSPPGEHQRRRDRHVLLRHAALVLDLDDEGEVGRGRHVVGLAADELDVAGAALGGDVDERDAVDAGELGRLAHALERQRDRGRVERLPGEVVGGGRHRHVADALVGHGLAGRLIHELLVVGVGTAEVAVQGGDLLDADLLVGEGAEHGRAQQAESSRADLHARGEHRLLVVERPRRLEPARAHGDLLLQPGELPELLDELLARELGGVVHDGRDLLAERHGVVDGRGDAVEVGAVRVDLAVVLAAARPPGDAEHHHEEDGRQDGQALDAGAAAVGATSGRRSGRRAAGVGRRAAALVVEEIHPADPPFSGGWWARGDLNPHERKLTRP